MSLIEVMIGFLILAVSMVGMLNLLAVAVVTSYRDDQAATTLATVAQNKIEELMNLEFGDDSSDTRVVPTAPTGGSGMCGAMAPNSICGSIARGGQVAGFFDLIDKQGDRVADPAGALLIRQWEIRADDSGQLKLIAVRATLLQAQGSGPRPSTVLTTMRARM